MKKEKTDKIEARNTKTLWENNQKNVTFCLQNDEKTPFFEQKK